MFALSTVLIAGGLAYTGSFAYKQLRHQRERLRFWRGDRRTQPIHRVAEAPPAQSDSAKSLARANHSLTISSLSLGITVAGILVKPALVLVSVPAALFIFAPTLQDAWQTLRQERKITPPVLDATRVTACILLGYYVPLALDTWLRTLTQRLLLRTEAEFQSTLDEYFVESVPAVWAFTAGAEIETALTALAVGDIIAVAAGELIPADGVVRYGAALIDERFVKGNVQAVHKTVGDAVFASTLVCNGQIYLEVTALSEESGTGALRARLEKTIEAGNYLANAGEQSGKAMAPPMWAAFALLLPFWEANRAAGFLTTSFGSQMTRLGPYALQNFANAALAHHILIYDGHALETLNLINTIVIEAAVLTDPDIQAQAHAAIYALRQRRWPMQEVAPHRFAIYLLADGDEVATKRVAASLGLDDYFVEPSATARAALLDRLRVGGRFVCYVGSGAEATSVTDKALVSVAIPSVGPHAIRQAELTAAQVVFLEKELKRLVQLFELAQQFGISQGFNLAWPLLMDLVDISTTVFFHFGLTYSLLFSYSGVLGSALYTRLPLLRYQAQQRHKPPMPLDPDRQIETTKLY